MANNDMQKIDQGNLRDDGVLQIQNQSIWEYPDVAVAHEDGGTTKEKILRAMNKEEIRKRKSKK